MRKSATWILALCLVAGSVAAELTPLGNVEFTGQLDEPHDLSTVQTMGDVLVIGSDETTHLQVLEKTTATHYKVARDRTIPLLPDSPTEIDIEALAGDGETLYVLGSHSRARQRVRDDRSRVENLRRLEKVKVEASRDHLFRLRVDTHGNPQAPGLTSKSLRPLLKRHPVLSLFTKTPSKENGIDFEGLAVAESRLFLGLRGPILRGNYVPVLSLRFDDIERCADAFAEHPEACRTLYVNLGGRGIRSLHRVTGGFLIVAGPMGDGSGSYQLYLWDGRDCILDDGAPECRLDLLGELPTPEATGAEGLAVLAEDAGMWEILVVYDGSEEGARFSVRRP